MEIRVATGSIKIFADNVWFRSPKYAFIHAKIKDSVVECQRKHISTSGLLLHNFCSCTYRLSNSNKRYLCFPCIIGITSLLYYL